MKRKRCTRKLPKLGRGGSPDQAPLQPVFNSNTAQATGSQFNNAAGNAGIWGAAFKATQGIASLAGEGIGGDAGGFVQGFMDPAGMLMDESMSTKERVSSALLAPLGGGMIASRARARQKKKQERARLSNTISGFAQESFSQKMQENPQQISTPTFANGGPITVPKVEGTQRATADSVKNYQGILTEALANKTKGLLNVDSILTANTNKPDFNRLRIPQYAQQIIDTSGDYALTPEEQKVALGTEYDKYVKATRNYRKNRTDYSGVVNTKGVLEQNPDVSQENFGIRNMLERMPWSKEEGTPYTYLKRKANGGLLTYDGQTHQGPNGGIPVDEKGNPSAQSGNKPVALAENKEVAWNLSNNVTLIFA